MAVPSDAELEDLARRVGRVFVARGLRAGTAESCTGGWVAKVITDIAGSSGWFEGGFVTYSNAAKTSELGVPQALIETHGAVSEPVAAAMAEGVRGRLPVDLVVAVSGVAGPGGGTPQKPVGTVCFAWADADGTVTERVHFGGDRDAVRRASVAHALAGLLARVRG